MVYNLRGKVTYNFLNHKKLNATFPPVFITRFLMPAFPLRSRIEAVPSVSLHSGEKP